MDFYGDLAQKYGVDWEVLSAAGLNVAMVGYGVSTIMPVDRLLPVCFGLRLIKRVVGSRYNAHSRCHQRILGV